ncbi:MAG TPA: diaminopimelate decarboxylase [bacterium]
MNFFNYRNNELYCEEVPIKKIVREAGTPLYIYSSRTLKRHFKEFDEPFKPISHITCYSVKANSNLSLISLFASMGSGADVVSGGELFRALKGGIPPKKIVFSGVGKTEMEIKEALKAGILLFNAESEEELSVINEVAGKLKKKAPVSLRINPDIVLQTHHYISTGAKINKFGVPFQKAIGIYSHAKRYKHLNFAGIDAHIGSQITMLTPFIETIRRLHGIISEIKKGAVNIKYLDIGGGLGITYDEEDPPHPREYASALIKELKGWKGALITEPGRVIVGNAGILVTKVIYRKENSAKKFIIVDAGMNDLIRPALYGAFQEIVPVDQKEHTIVADVVGPICESGDFFAKERMIADVRRDDLLAIMGTGAYGFSMSSNYNSRGRAAEVVVDGSKYRIIRSRETYPDLIRGEKIFLRKG